MKLSEFLKEKLAGRGTQARFARETGISDGTVSKWARGEMDRAPNFENCLWIANYFHEKPETIFVMAERPDYLKLFNTLFPKYESPSAPGINATNQCCPAHEELYQKLGEILHGPEIWASGITANIHGMWLAGRIPSEIAQDIAAQINIAPVTSQEALMTPSEGKKPSALRTGDLHRPRKTG